MIGPGQPCWRAETASSLPAWPAPTMTSADSVVVSMISLITSADSSFIVRPVGLTIGPMGRQCNRVHHTAVQEGAMTRVRAHDYDDKRNVILSQAAALIARKGFDVATMMDVAEACGTSKSHLYHYFPGK